MSDRPSPEKLYADFSTYLRSQGLETEARVMEQQGAKLQQQVAEHDKRAVEHEKWMENHDRCGGDCGTRCNSGASRA
jgi:hypothetical protein